MYLLLWTDRALLSTGQKLINTSYLIGVNPKIYNGGRTHE